MGNILPSWDKFEQVISPIGLLFVLAFPIVVGVPLIGYLFETVAIFYVIFYLYLIVSAIGSLTIAILIYGPGLLIFSMWAKVILPGALFGYLMTLGMPASRAFVMTVGLVIAVALVLFWAEKEAIAAVLDNVQKWIQGGLIGSSERNHEVIDWAIRTIALIKRLIPALIALSGVAQLFVGWVLLVIMLKAMGEFFPGFIDFYYWKMPDFYLFIIGLAIAIRLIGGDTIKIVADNIIMFIGFFYAAFGFAVFEYYLKKIRLSLFLRILFYIGFIFLQLPGLILAAAVGLFDSYFDFRNVKARIIG